LYGLAHGRIEDVLTDMGIPVGCRGESVTAGNQEFLCFQRGDCNDLLVAGHKIVGSAQRRRRGAILQHGSLLLQRSPHAPEIPGLRELGYGIAADELLVTELTNALSGLLGAEEKHRESLPDGIIELATELEKNRYQKRDWKTHG